MTRNAVFKWDKEKEQAYQDILKMMNSKTTLRPYDKNKTTHSYPMPAQMVYRLAYTRNKMTRAGNQWIM